MKVTYLLTYLLTYLVTFPLKMIKGVSLVPSASAASATVKRSCTLTQSEVAVLRKELCMHNLKS